jgi:hypothetical protein
VYIISGAILPSDHPRPRGGRGSGRRRRHDAGNEGGGAGGRFRRGEDRTEVAQECG